MADNQEELPFDQILKNYDDEIAKKEIEKREKLTKALQSGDADTILKASQYYQQMVNRDKSNAKSLLIDTWQLNRGFGYQERESKLSYGMLRGMSHTPVIRAIIDTRKEQVASFAQSQPDRFSTGFIIRRKGKQDEEPTSKDKREIDRLTEFILNSGTDGNAWHADDFENFLRKFTEDSVSLDQGVFENVFTRGGELVEYFATDGTTYRIADSFDDDRGNTKNTRKINGYYPSYVQLDVHGKIWAEFYPWELCFGVRNPQTNLRRNGYGYSELEDLIQTVTSLLNADLYNANYFKQGSNPKGLLKVQGLNQNRVEEFKNQWQSEVSGVTNSHKLPVIDAESMDFISTQLSNKDMEFSDYQKYLIKLSCAIFKISPNEIGFEVDDATQKLSDSSNEAELEFSKDKGLKPLLRFIQKNINKYIISQLNPEFEFVFVGLDSNTEAEEEERLNKATGTYMTPNEVRALKGMEPLKDDAADMILNPVFAQAKQMAMMGDPDSNGAIDNMNDDAEKSEEGNPLLKDLNNWIDKLNYEDAIS